MAKLFNIKIDIDAFLFYTNYSRESSDSMQRKYIYTLVIILSLIASISNYYIDINMNLQTAPDLETANKIESNYNHNEDMPTDAIYTSSLKSPLVIVNNQNNDEVIEYTYHLKINNVRGSHPYSKGAKTGYIVFSANGETTFTLKSNERLTIYDIPNEVDYNIEQVTDVSKNYTTKINDKIGTSTIGSIGAETYIIFDNNTINDDVVLQETPVQPETSKPIEEPKPNINNNPVTADSVYWLVIVLMLATGVLFVLSKLKIKRYQ